MHVQKISMISEGKHTAYRTLGYSSRFLVLVVGAWLAAVLVLYLWVSLVIWDIPEYDRNPMQIPISPPGSGISSGILSAYNCIWINRYFYVRIWTQGDLFESSHGVWFSVIILNTGISRTYFCLNQVICHAVSTSLEYISRMAGSIAKINNYY